MNIYILKDFHYDENEREVVSNFYILTHETKFTEAEWSEMVYKCRVHRAFEVSMWKTADKLKEEYGFQIAPIATI